MPNRTFVRIALACALPLVLAGCQAPAPGPGDPPAPMPKEKLAPGSSPLSPALTDATARAQAGPPTQQEKLQAHLYKGTGVVVRGLQPGGGLPPGPAVQAAGGNVVLNFEGADLREVVRNILGDILNENYTIDPAVGGTVTIRTSSGIPRDALPATLETLLRMNGATMVQERRPVHGRAAGGRHPRQPDAAARQLDARAAVRLLGADRAAALRRRARDAAAARALREGRAGGAPGRAAQHADPVGDRARAPPPDGHDRHVRHRLDGGHVGGRVHAQELRRQAGDDRTREDRRRPQREPDHRHPQDRPHRADERAAGRHAAARVPRGSEEVDRAPRPQQRYGRRPPVLRLPPAEHAGRAAGAAAAAGVHRPRDAAGRRRGAHARAGHAGRHHRQPAAVLGAAGGAGRQSRRAGRGGGRRRTRRRVPPRRAAASCATCRWSPTRTTTRC